MRLRNQRRFGGTVWQIDPFRLGTKMNVTVFGLLFPPKLTQFGQNSAADSLDGQY